MSPPGSFKQYALNVLNKNICSLSILPERNKIKAEESLIANQPNDVYLKSFFFLRWLCTDVMELQGFTCFGIAIACTNRVQRANWHVRLDELHIEHQPRYRFWTQSGTPF